ncbi:MAG TPA: lysophospholipase [Thermoanaerobaculia bacterium]|nr:lysophospholipase [Thermoanaerobaculia bacterium]
MDTLKAAGGLSLAVERHPVADRRARVVIVHGYAEHKGRYRKLVSELTGAGYECHLFDLRGHGGSGGRRGHVARFGDYREDLHLVARAAGADLPPGVPLILLGHSLGGLVSLDFVIHHPETFAALAVSSPFLAPAFSIPPLKKTLGTLAARVLPTLAVPSGLDAAWLSHDPEVVRAYTEDPLVFPTTTLGWFTAVEAAQEEVFARAPEIRLPALFLIGSGDPIAAPPRARALFARLGSADKRLEVYDGLFHEVFNELERARVVADLLAWLEERTQPR